MVILTIYPFQLSCGACTQKKQITKQLYSVTKRKEKSIKDLRGTHHFTGGSGNSLLLELFYVRWDNGILAIRLLVNYMGCPPHASRVQGGRQMRIQVDGVN